jgi:N-acetylglucosaminyldiphosphoundecaprenol N-acetyl-beta-D-mannosaminyltransferase
VDFGRNLCFVLGLPFDLIDLDTAVARIRSAAATRTRLFVSTPNTNFVVAARRNPAFRDSVFHSDLSLMDGTPLVWASRMMGIPVPERVSGADVFEALNRPGSEPISVYFFGGREGAAPAAAAKINSAQGPMRCVGYDEAGFGSVEQMSDEATIERINASGADFLVVSLGAVKGQAWIEHNLPRLTVPVVSHLGAVVNFVAGSVKRAPPWMRRSGLEWLWRIKEEPYLWRRYALDALVFLQLLLLRAVPCRAYKKSGSPESEASPLDHRLTSTESTLSLSLGANAGGPGLRQLNTLLSEVASQDKPLLVDATLARAFDSGLAASLVVLRAHRLRCQLPQTTVKVSPQAARMLALLGADRYLLPVD